MIYPRRPFAPHKCDSPRTPRRGPPGWRGLWRACWCPPERRACCKAWGKPLRRAEAISPGDLPERQRWRELRRRPAPGRGRRAGAATRGPGRPEAGPGSGARPAVPRQVRGGQGRAGAGADPSPYPPRSGGAGAAPASAAQPEPRRRPPPSRWPRRLRRRVAPPQRHHRGPPPRRPPAIIPPYHDSDWLPIAAALESGAVSQGRRPLAAVGTGAGRPPEAWGSAAGEGAAQAGAPPSGSAKRRQPPPGGAEVPAEVTLAPGGASWELRGVRGRPWKAFAQPAEACQSKLFLKTSDVVFKKKSFIERQFL